MMESLLGLFWPQVCPLCEFEVTGGDRIHPRCLAGLVRARRAAGDSVIACFEDGPGWFRLLHQWKYGGERGLVATVAACMAASVAGIPGDAVLVPVPDDPDRVRQRGYSPVGDLAAELARRIGLLVDGRLLRRARRTPSQTSCPNDAARQLNIRHAFRAGDLSRWPRSRALVLVEDQVTSGATVAEATSLLAARGAPVRVWCAARAARAPRQLDAATGRN